MRVDNMIIVKPDINNKITIPKEIRKEFPKGQHFAIKFDNNTKVITLIPIKIIATELDNGLLEVKIEQ